MDMSRRLTALLHRVGPQHLQPSAMVANVEYYSIFESDMFTICVFALRAGASMPIHDHPEMNVFRLVGF
jgi:quercetin dioxygenase-like cupin family protein